MKLLKTLNKFKPRFFTALPSNDIYLKLFSSICILCCIAILIWTAGPLMEWGDFAPLAQPEKRAYAILFIFLSWLLKFLLIDLGASELAQYNDPAVKERLRALQQRFDEVILSLKNATMTVHGKLFRMNQLPWHLLIGPEQSGKTSLIINSHVNFNLKGQTDTDNCNWWVTRDISIIDVPGKYTTSIQSKPSIVWTFLLRLIQKQRGNNGIGGIIIALPLPEMMRQGDPKKYQAQLHTLFLRIHEIQALFPRPLPCHLVITKCDLLPGFVEFFSESSNSEITQSWGVLLQEPKNNEKLTDLFSKRFNALIKKLNQQLLWRLHQERNPSMRPQIKDFPLQVERLKEFTLDFIKKFTGAHLSLSLQGIYLTSALQKHSDSPLLTIAPHHHLEQRSVQLFNMTEPPLSSRPYFIKQLITHGFIAAQEDYATAISSTIWKRRLAYATSLSVIGLTAIVLGRDFQTGVKHAYAIQNSLSAYQLAIQSIRTPEEHLEKTISLLNTLQQSAKNSSFKIDLSYILTFYSHKSVQKASDVYRHALQTLLMPEIKGYLEDYLKNPVNKDEDHLYSTLKAYLMLGNASRLQPDFIPKIVRDILPKSMSEGQITQLMNHVNLAVTVAWDPLSLNQTLIQQTRKYLASKPASQLGYIILKSINSNNTESEVNLGTNVSEIPVLASKQITNQVPSMFTAKSFTNIISEEMAIAAQEASAGNWVLGENLNVNKDPEYALSLMEQLRTLYVNNYVDVWESLLANIHLQAPKNLAETDALITALSAKDSPLIQLLKTLHDNTYFEPVASSSPKLQGMSLLVDKNNRTDLSLPQIMANLQAVHTYLQTIMSAPNEKKAAFDAMSSRIQNRNNPDPITQLRTLADKSPEPIKIWLMRITDYAWRYLMADATQYIDMTWKNEISHFYLTDIASRFPFNSSSTQAVDLQKFTLFFGNPGMIADFYANYLQPFVDTSGATWHWRQFNNEKLIFSESALQQIQYATKIDHILFPNGHSAKALTAQPKRLSLLNLDQFRFPLQLSEPTDIQ